MRNNARFPILIISLCLVAIGWYLVFLNIDSERKSAIQSAERETRYLAHAYAQNIAGIIKRADLVLIDIARDWIERTHKPADFERDFERYQAQLNDILVQAGVIDREGFVRTSSTGVPNPPVNLAYREHFKVHADKPSNRLYISKPVLGKVSGKWSVQLTRAILRNGAFDGVVVFSISPETLGNFHSVLNLGANGIASVIRDDGTVLVRNPGWEKYIGQVIESAPYLGPEAPNQGNFIRKSSIDGIERVFGFHRLEEYGLTMVVAFSFDQINESLKSYRQSIMGVSLLATLLFLLLVSATLSKYAHLEQLVVQRTRDLTGANRQLSRAASVFENTTEGIIVTDPETRIIMVNPAFTAITGYALEEVVGKKPNLLRSDHHAASFYEEMWSSLTSTGVWRGELWNRRKDGEAFLESVTINRITGQDGKAEGYVAVFRDITDLHQQHQAIEHLAFHDALTGLPNRMLLLDRLARAMHRAQRESSMIAVEFLDLDRFKAANDAFGHEFGDKLLQAVAERVKSCLRGVDTVARLGGDEFIILLEDVKDPKVAESIATDLIQAIQSPFEIDGHQAIIGASIGIALYPQDGDTAEKLIKCADHAMYAAKSAGRSTYRLNQSG